MLETEQREFRREVPEEAQLDFLSALDTSKSWNDPASIIEGYDGVIFGGSGEFDLHGNREDTDIAKKTAREILARLEPLMHYVVSTDFPTLGVCFGHQLLAEMHGGNIVSDDAQKKAGTYDVVLTDDAKSDRIFSDFPPQFAAQYGHRDSVTSLPKDALLLATGSACRFSALRYGQSVYTVQFHPEMTREDAIERFKKAPGYLPEGMEPEDLVRESLDASRIIPLFVEKVVA